MQGSDEMDFHSFVVYERNTGTYFIWPNKNMKENALRCVLLF